MRRRRRVLTRTSEKEQAPQNRRSLTKTVLTHIIH